MDEEKENSDYIGQCDTETLERMLLSKPTFNPALCKAVKPKKCEDNPFKVEKDAALSLDYLLMMLYEQLDTSCQVA